MKAILIILVFPFYCPICWGQHTVPKTELFIIGTVHSGNKHFNHQTIYKLLQWYKPDVVLWEQSTVFKRVWGLRTAAFLKIAKPGIEQLALQKYARRIRKTPILPFDTSFASRSQYLKSTTKMEAALFDSLSNALMGEEDRLKYLEYVEKRNRLFQMIFNEDLVRINQPDVIAISRELYQLEIQQIVPIAESYISDRLLADAYKADLDFWIARNDFMVQQIKGYLKKFAGKRILVLTGLNHKYYLIDGLSILEKEWIQFKDLPATVNE